MSAIDNWYVALELPFEPTPESDPGAIDARIAAKIEYWSRRANDPSNGGKFTRWREKADQMRKDLRDPEIRHRMAAEALELTFGRLDATLRQASNNGKQPIASANLAKIATIRGVSLDVAASRAAAVGVTIDEGTQEDPAEFQSAFDEIYATKPSKYSMFEGFRADLETAGATDLYDFIALAIANLDDSGATRPDPRSASTAELRAAGEQLRREFFRKTNTAEKVKATAGKYCETAFADDDARRQYDMYLEYLELRKCVDSITEDVELAGRRCAPGTAADHIASLNRFIKNGEKSAAFFVALCRVKGFDYDPSSGGAESLEPRQACRCGMINVIRDGASNCTRCGLPLVRRCPQCRLNSPNSFDFCPCGFDFLNVFRAGAACEKGLEAVSEYDLGGARSKLEEATRLFPGLPQIASLAEAIQQLDRTMGSSLSAIDSAVAALNFQQARTLLIETQGRYTRYRNPGLARHIDDQLARATAKLAEARALTESDEVLRVCREVYTLCRDLAGLPELVARHTDLPLDALVVNDATVRNVSVAQVNHRVAVRLDVPGEGETGILVAYRFDAFPTKPDDPAAIVREFPVAELQHEGVLRLETAQPRTYFVAVFLKFAGAGRPLFSRPQYGQLDLGSKIVTTYSFTKKRFPTRILLQLDAIPAVDRLPEIHLVYQVGHAPVYESSGEVLMTIPAQPVTYPCSFQIPGTLPKNAYVKAFVHEDPVFQLRIATGATHQVS